MTTTTTTPSHSGFFPGEEGGGSRKSSLFGAHFKCLNLRCFFVPKQNWVRKLYLDGRQRGGTCSDDVEEGEELSINEGGSLLVRFSFVGELGRLGRHNELKAE